MTNPYTNETLQTIRNLSASAQDLFAEILTKDVTPSAYIGSAAWEELTDLDLVNHWTDDNGTEFVEIGNQL